MKFTDTLTKTKRDFIPLVEGKVGMYVCGPTVYNTVHIGNARPAVVFDSLRRYFEYRGYKVTYVMNFTDIDDKIISRINEEGWDFETITSTFIREYLRDMRSLGVKDANFNPRISQYIPETIVFVERLISRGYAYVVENEVFYDVTKFAGYGELSHRKLDDMLSGARIEVDQKKRNPGDFTLWKPAKEGEPSWESPWGLGRPGWHIECSVMATSILGETFDIHAGGNDLIFPHHENERAQSEACTGSEFSRYWLHNGMLQMNGAKMAKSVGNIISVREAVRQYGKEAVRMFIFSTQFRAPIDYSEERFEDWKKAAQRVEDALVRVEELSDGIPPFSKAASEWVKEKRQSFIDYLDDDFNTSRVLSLIFEIVKEMNSTDDMERLFEGYWLIKGEIGDVMGLFTDVPTKKQGESVSATADDVMAIMVAVRNSLRAARQFELADMIRDGLNERGISLLDGPEGTKWQIK
ncbi:MAG TPA: cysteine--tRNA ligase [Thermotogota bacterium]|nr:cysteine--tRNA ligase [Thermotogota bacterium]HPJ87648.1 cysteine--tRNA ligase [Thermotogota bacterium]HPR94914.1 cysteine--tRNA ligase [Thermotogota bacterium]